jgi:putative oxidoreductase
MDVVVLIGRIVFTAIFLTSGVDHLTKTEAMTGYAASKRMPAPRLAVVGSGLYLLVAGVMIVLGVWADLAALALVPFLLLTAFVFHPYWTETDPATKTNERVLFLKDISLAGGALVLFALYALTSPGLSVTGALLY